jgi:ferredoxin
MKAAIDQDLCVGCGLCPDICPEVFEMGEDTATVKVVDVPAAVEASCVEAMESCPVEAIVITGRDA